MGVITYEFLCGIPPFHADIPERVFANILSGHVEWDEDWIDCSPEAHDFITRLLVSDPSKRLGAKGANEVKAHSFFTGVEWDKVATQEAQFIPQVTDPESTDYFDLRGALPQVFQDDDEPPSALRTVLSDSPGSDYLATPPILASSATSPGAPDDFGTFSFKNLPVLKQANDDVIRKLKTEAKPEVKPLPASLPSPSMLALDAPAVNRRRSMSQRMKKPPSVVTGTDKVCFVIVNERQEADNYQTGVPTNAGPPSPSTSVSSIASSPSRISQVAQISNISGGSHLRRPSEYGPLERFKASQVEGDPRRNSMPSRLRTASVSSADQALSDSSEAWPPMPRAPAKLVTTSDKKRADANDKVVTCLIAEDNPISQKILETVLTRMGCRCILASDGAEAISIASGDISELAFCDSIPECSILAQSLTAS